MEPAVHQYASDATGIIHNHRVLIFHCQVPREYPVPKEPKARQLYISHWRPSPKLFSGLPPSKALPCFLSKDCQTSASSLRYDTAEEYIRTHRHVSVRDASARLYRHASNFHDYVKLLSEIRLFRKKNKLPHHLRQKLGFPVLNLHSLPSVYHNLPQRTGSRLPHKTKDGSD